MYIQQQNSTNNTSHNSRQMLQRPAILLRASTSIFNYFFKAPSSFSGDDSEVAGPTPSPKTHVIKLFFEFKLISVKKIWITCYTRVSLQYS